MSEAYPRTFAEVVERRFSDGLLHADRKNIFELAMANRLSIVLDADMKNSLAHIRRGLWLCGGCRMQVSVLAGAVFQDTHLPLTVWFRAMWHITSQKNGVSALGLQRALGLGSYKTAWLILHKLRQAMVRPGRERLRGVVEVDETVIGAQQNPADATGRPGLQQRRSLSSLPSRMAKCIGRILHGANPRFSIAQRFA